MSSIDIIELIDKSIKVNNRKIEDYLEALVGDFPGSVNVDNKERKLFNEIFQTQDIKEKNDYVKEVRDFVNIMINDYIDYLKLIYEQSEAYIKRYIDNETKYNRFKEEKENKKKFKKEKRGELYKIIQYLIEVKKIELNNDDMKIIQIMDKDIRLMRNKFAHGELPLINDECAEYLLICGNITSVLSALEDGNKKYKAKNFTVIKELLAMLDKKLLSEKNRT